MKPPCSRCSNTGVITRYGFSISSPLLFRGWLRSGSSILFFFFLLFRSAKGMSVNFFTTLKVCSFFGKNATENDYVDNSKKKALILYIANIIRSDLLYIQQKLYNIYEGRNTLPRTTNRLFSRQVDEYLSQRKTEKKRRERFTLHNPTDHDAYCSSALRISHEIFNEAQTYRHSNDEELMFQ